jgi:hypothetical protein
MKMLSILALTASVALAPVAAMADYDAQIISDAAAKDLGERGVVEQPSNWRLRRDNLWTPGNLTVDEHVALKVLCRLGVTANSSTRKWESVRLNAAIAVLAFGASQPNNLLATVYKTCMVAGGMAPR